MAKDIVIIIIMSILECKRDPLRFYLIMITGWGKLSQRERKDSNQQELY